MAKSSKPVSKPIIKQEPKTKTFSDRQTQDGKFSDVKGAMDKPGYISKPNITSETKPPSGKR